MKNKVFGTVLSACLVVGVSASAWAANVQTVPVKMGYFNLAQIKLIYPESVAATSLEERAKEMLRRDLNNANTELAEMQKQNKPKEEIEKRKADLQREVQAKQEAMAGLLSGHSAEANRAISSAVAAVAKEKGLDIVIDAAGIYAGGDKFANNGEDVTESILKRLVPTMRTEAAPGHAEASPSAKK